MLGKAERARFRLGRGDGGRLKSQQRGQKGVSKFHFLSEFRSIEMKDVCDEKGEASETRAQRNNGSYRMTAAEIKGGHCQPVRSNDAIIIFG